MKRRFFGEDLRESACFVNYSFVTIGAEEAKHLKKVVLYWY